MVKQILKVYHTKFLVWALPPLCIFNILKLYPKWENTKLFSKNETNSTVVRKELGSLCLNVHARNGKEPKVISTGLLGRKGRLKHSAAVSQAWGHSRHTVVSLMGWSTGSVTGSCYPSHTAETETNRSPISGLLRVGRGLLGARRGGEAQAEPQTENSFHTRHVCQ